MKKPLLVFGVAAIVLIAATYLVYRKISTPDLPEAAVNEAHATTKDSVCTAAVSALLRADDADCDRKLAVYSGAIQQCRDQYVMVEDPEPYETVFADEVFEVYRCYLQKGDAAKSREALELALRSGDWQMNGPAGCSGHTSARAEIESITRKTSACVKPDGLEAETKKIVSSLKPGGLDVLLGNGTVLSTGTYESDDVCPTTLADLSEPLKKTFDGVTSPKLLKHETSEDGERMIFARSSGEPTPWMVLDFVLVNGCEHLSQVLFNEVSEGQ